MTTPTEQDIRLYGRIFLEMDIVAMTGIRIGGSPATMEIGGIDNPVIRDPITQQPYIPGSSLRGKMRSLWEKATGAEQNQSIGRDVRLHMIKKRDNESIADYQQRYEEDPVCRIFGVTGDNDVPNPTRLIIHDTFMTEASVDDLEKRAQTDQPYTETKWEAVIDRVTSAAVPRQMERVPAQTRFAPCRLVYNIFGSQSGALTDIDWFTDIIQMLQLVEDDYLGSSGSRGSGQIGFENFHIYARKTGDNGEYMNQLYLGQTDTDPYSNLSTLWQDKDAIVARLHELIG